MSEDALQALMDNVNVERTRAHDAGEHDYERGVEFVWNGLVALASSRPEPLDAARNKVIEAARVLNLMQPDMGDDDPLSDLDDALGELEVLEVEIRAAAREYDRLGDKG